MKVKSSNKKAGVLFCGIFAIVGTIMFYFFTFQPLYGFYSAKGWVETPCKIISAQVGSHSGRSSRHRGTTYSVDIRYKYSFEGREYQSSDYNFFNIASSGSAGKHAIVNQYKNMSDPACYVNPDKPQVAVLDRELSADYWLALIPLPFMFFGYTGIYWALSKKPKAGMSADSFSSQAVTTVEDSPEAASEPTASESEMQEYHSSEPVEFKATNTPSNLLVLLVFAAFWNGLVSFFAYSAIAGKEYFVLVFLSLFVIIGLFLFFLCLGTFMQLFNPKLNITLSPGILAPGQKASVVWEIVGKSQKVKHLTFSIRCGEMEKRNSSGGKKTVSKGKGLYDQTIAEIEAAGELGSGSFTFTVPADALATLSSDDYKRYWQIRGQGTIDLWPDIRESHEFKVLSRTKSEV